MPGITHVLYLAEIPGRNPFSGAEYQILLLVEELARCGQDVHLIVLLWSAGPKPMIDARIAELRAAGVRVTSLDRPVAAGRLANWWHILGAWLRLRRLLTGERGRIVHLHLDFIFTLVVARLAGCGKICVTFHNDEPAYARWPYRLWFRVANRLVWRYVGITRHVSAHVRVCSGARPEQVRTIYYGMRPPVRAAVTRADLGLPAAAFVIGFVGRLTEQKNLPAFLAAVGELPLQCVLIGAGPQREELEALVRARGLTNVRFLGMIPNAAGYMTLFDLFCLPSEWEGLGLVLIEAMLQRVPVAGSRRGAIPEILGDGRYGLLFQPDTASIRVALAAAVAAQAENALRAEAAHDHVCATFTIDKLVQRTLQLYATGEVDETA